ncbi:MAG: DNA topoisomerase VI subunit B [Candidatus Woesearchaeota archaeon]|jgi:DNA topoisomerase-6 subunit B
MSKVAEDFSNVAKELATKQREIGVAEFFARNRHLLGFDNKRKALMTTIKEAVDNALDACEEAGILPEINVQIIDMQNERFRVIIEDNGPGIVKEQIGRIFAKLLYGSKFHKMAQSRGQQGIGISAAVMYGQLTTGKPAKITSKTGPKEQAHFFELKIDTKKNEPIFIREDKMDWYVDHGTKIEIDLEGSYQKGGQSVDEYLKQTAITNPHATFIYTTPKAEQIIYPRVTDVLPPKPVGIKPHPYGVELGVLMSMIDSTTQKTISSFLQAEFSRVSPSVCKEILEEAKVLPQTKVADISRDIAERIFDAIKKVKIQNPPTDCIFPIGAELLEKGLRKEIPAEFYASTTRPADVYRGNPFVIEVGVAYGGNQNAEESANVLRFANRVPLLFQQGACAITKSIQATAWRGYGLSQPSGSMPIGPLTIMVHIASVWVPFTSESKEAIAHYPEIIKEVKLALQEVGRKLAQYVLKKRRVSDEFKKRAHIEKYLPFVAEALKESLSLSDGQRDIVVTNLTEILSASRKSMVHFKEGEGTNQDFDEMGDANLKGAFDDEIDDDSASSDSESDGDDKKSKSKKKKSDDDDSDTDSDDDDSTSEDDDDDKPKKGKKKKNDSGDLDD